MDIHERYSKQKPFVRGMIKGAIVAVVLMIAGLLFSGCGNDDYDHLPREIQTFLNTYYPGQGVSTFQESAGTITVNLDNSATLIFNPSLIWISVNGNGNVLPRQFLFDQFPSPLYDYIETTDNLDEVFSAVRNAGIYTITFHNYIIDYNSVSEEITPVTETLPVQ